MRSRYSMRLSVCPITVPNSRTKIFIIKPKNEKRLSVCYVQIVDRFYVKDGQTVKCQGQAPKGRMQSWNCGNGVGHRANTSCLCIFLPREQRSNGHCVDQSSNWSSWFIERIGYRSQCYYNVASHPRPKNKAEELPTPYDRRN